MQHSVGEQTPLLVENDGGSRQNNKNSNNTTQRRRPGWRRRKQESEVLQEVLQDDGEDDNDENHEVSSVTSSLFSALQPPVFCQEAIADKPRRRHRRQRADLQRCGTRAALCLQHATSKCLRRWHEASFALLPAHVDATSYEDVYFVHNSDDDDDGPQQYSHHEMELFQRQGQCGSFGTRERHGVWLNVSDCSGTLMVAMVWILILYSQVTMVLLVQHRHMAVHSAALYLTLSTLAWACHLKTCLTDPGSVPAGAVPLPHHVTHKFHPLCSRCQTYKPPFSHHCRICNRCISRMDHHCPWMNNCVGAGNLKHFVLFLLYTWLASAMALSIFAVNYFFCNAVSCEFSTTEIHLARTMSVIALLAWLFTSSMLMSTVYSIMTGIGTIDRLKKDATQTWHLSDETALPWTDVVGTGPWWTWLLPTDPFFPDYDQVMGYATTHRLLREQRQHEDAQEPPLWQQVQQQQEERRYPQTASASPARRGSPSKTLSPARRTSPVASLSRAAVQHETVSILTEESTSHYEEPLTVLTGAPLSPDRTSSSLPDTTVLSVSITESRGEI